MSIKSTETGQEFKINTPNETQFRKKEDDSSKRRRTN